MINLHKRIVGSLKKESLILLYKDNISSQVQYYHLNKKTIINNNLIQSLKTILKQNQNLFPKFAIDNKIKNSMITQIKYNYVIQDLFQSKNQQQFIKIQVPAFKLYLSRLKNFPFDQRNYIILMIDCNRTKQPFHIFQQMIQIGYKNINKIQMYSTVVTILAQMCLQNYKNKEIIQIFVKKSLQLAKNFNGLSFFNLKHMLSIEKLVGLDYLTQQDYQKMNLKRFKPLYICFVLELFFKNGLEKKYKLVDQLIDFFIKNEEYVPFGDVSHLSFTARVVRDGKFLACIHRIKKSIKLAGPIQSQKKQLTNDQNSNEDSQDNNQLQSIKLGQTSRINWNKYYVQDIKRKYAVQEQ